MEWISVEDRLPDKNETVLCYGVQKYQDIRTIFTATHEDKGVWSETNGDNFVYSSPCHNSKGEYTGHATATHWMPLPEPPVKKDKRR